MGAEVVVGRGGGARGSRRGGILVESLFGIVLMLVMVGGSLWMSLLIRCRIRALAADRHIAWNRGIENRGYSSIFGNGRFPDRNEAEIEQKILFGEGSGLLSDAKVNKVYYHLCVFGGDGEREGHGEVPSHWRDEKWALYRDGEEQRDIWTAQHLSASEITMSTPAAAKALVHDAPQYGFNRLQRDLPASLSFGGRTGGARDGERKIQVSGCVTMRTRARRENISAEESFLENAAMIRESAGNWFAAEE